MFKWEGMKCIRGNIHSFLFPRNFKFSFLQKLGIEGNEIIFNEFFY